jgi:electron transport complex protein RnfG
MAMPSDNGPAKERWRAPLVAALTLGALAAVIVPLLAWLQVHSEREIVRTELVARRAALAALLPADLFDNDLLADRIEITAPDSLGTRAPVPVYRARRQGQPAAVILQAVAPVGYRGPITLRIAIAYDGTVLRVQVLEHQETPGLGDVFELPPQRWLASFRGRSLASPPTARWSVRKDGGDFDQFTGATITPRAIVNAVRDALEYYTQHRAEIFAREH